jgi:hypothetical protein
MTHAGLSHRSNANSTRPWQSTIELRIVDLQATESNQRGSLTLRANRWNRARSAKNWDMTTDTELDYLHASD